MEKIDTFRANQWEHKYNRSVRRALLWVVVAGYTLALPNANYIYHFIVKLFSSELAGKVPITIIILMGIVYLIIVLAMKRGLKALALIVPCTIIVVIFMALESNPNKYIHIPEYVVMSWILFEALSLDYQGKGIFGLIFVCAALLGVVDEIAQGILPKRHYGWQDMAINSASALIGIVTLAGLRTLPSGDWTWVKCFKQTKKSLGVIFFGAVGALLTCIYLFDVKAHRTFQGTYPGWLLVWNGFLIAMGLVVIYQTGFYYQTLQTQEEKVLNPVNPDVTARLWILCPLAIIVIMHSLVVLAAFGGLTFH